jgi:hypothetical protein
MSSCCKCRQWAQEHKHKNVALELLNDEIKARSPTAANFWPSSVPHWMSSTPLLPCWKQKCGFPFPVIRGKAIEYDSLLYYEVEQDWTPRYPPIKERIDVRQLLDGIEAEGMRRARQLLGRLRHCHPSQLRQISMELGVSDEELAAAINARQPTKLMQMLAEKDRPGEWLLRLIRTQPGGLTRIAKQTIVQGDAIVSGDTFNMSGNFSGAILNIKATLDNVTQTVNNMPHADSAERQELQALIEQLQAELTKAPPELEKEAEAVAQTAKALVDTASAEQPNPTMIQITGEGLKKAAENIAGVMPTVVNNNSGRAQGIKDVHGVYDNLPGTPEELYRFEPVSFARIAEEMGCLGLRVEQPAEIRGAIERALVPNRQPSSKSSSASTTRPSPTGCRLNEERRLIGVVSSNSKYAETIEMSQIKDFVCGKKA